MNQVTGRIKGTQLTVVKYSHRDEKYRKVYLFRCDCGESKKIRMDNVQRNQTKSCGCLKKKIQSPENMSRVRGFPKDPEKMERLKEDMRNRPDWPPNKGKARIEISPGSKKYKYVTEKELTEIYYGLAG